MFYGSPALLPLGPLGYVLDGSRLGGQDFKTESRDLDCRIKYGRGYLLTTPDTAEIQPFAFGLGRDDMRQLRHCVRDDVCQIPGLVPLSLGDLGPDRVEED